MVRLGGQRAVEQYLLTLRAFRLGPAMPEGAMQKHGRTRRGNGLLGGWVTGWLGGWVAGWLGCWVAGWLGGWAGWLGGWVAGWLGGWMAAGKQKRDTRISQQAKPQSKLGLGLQNV